MAIKGPNMWRLTPILGGGRIVTLPTYLNGFP
jgi:hypothetical protein